MVYMNQFYTLLTDFNPNLKFKSYIMNFVEIFVLLVSVFNKGKLCSISFVICHHKFRLKFNQYLLSTLLPLLQL